MPAVAGSLDSEWYVVSVVPVSYLQSQETPSPGPSAGPRWVPDPSRFMRAGMVATRRCMARCSGSCFGSGGPVGGIAEERTSRSRYRGGFRGTGVAGGQGVGGAGVQRLRHSLVARPGPGCCCRGTRSGFTRNAQVGESAIQIGRLTLRRAGCGCAGRRRWRKRHHLETNGSRLDHNMLSNVEIC